MSPTFTPALLTVVDGDDPSNKWHPWGATANDVREAAASVETPNVVEREQYAYRFELLLHTPVMLRARVNWMGVVGSLIDLTRPHVDPDLQEWMCHCIAKSTSPLVDTVGYHMVFVVGGASDAQDRMIDRFETGAERALGSAIVNAGEEISSLSHLTLTLRTIERKMRRFAREQKRRGARG
jgi:hypothetical protein